MKPQPSEVRKAMENIGAVKRCLRAVSSEEYAETGLGDTQMRILRYVASHPSVSQAELARETETDPSLTGRALQGLLDRGVLKRERSKEDKRAFRLELAPRGTALLAQVDKASARLVSRIVAPLDARDVADFNRIAAKLTAALGPGSPSED